MLWNGSGTEKRWIEKCPVHAKIDAHRKEVEAKYTQLAEQECAEFAAQEQKKQLNANLEEKKQQLEELIAEKKQELEELLEQQAQLSK